MVYLGISEDKQKGLTLIEFLIAIGLVAIISSAIGIRLITFRQKSSIATTHAQIITDIKSQQVKSMVLDTEGEIPNSYGVHFDVGSYVLFKGTTYTISDAANFVVKLGSDVSFQSILFPSQNIIFTKGSGEISDFVSGSDSFTLHDNINGDKKTIKLNVNGVVISVL
ncbi:MAG: hypothetical protein A3G13_03340 [Candidatus Levybacteria bacterium RIFCSPLOWO2_12_FULL_37_7]|nr:MAG: hypothetical protein A2770_02480 [Candidatus Levybacteria bacterium RIFCSPHIGHO2_01_FULL_38_12]OGH44367.1 MAG: hypothetical protein A3J14_02185 [Candidatus Levybacteria bacterium RIFCSPLOWO2_02_FULL_37_18]OGH51308.1 MAG: hypothetical protein A3G13_03340 [Candidatus Levybacteria bacterium RIFCSPLOWO2_12_FULL_37_7]